MIGYEHSWESIQVFMFSSLTYPRREAGVFS
jgi:hypothetical protein